MEKINILILGLGGNVSQGILKAVKMANLNCKIFGACVNSSSVGLYFCDTAYISPYAHSKDFMPWLIELCNKEHIDVVLTGVEEIILKIAKNLEEFHNKTDALFICSEYEKLLIGQNKYKTCVWLKENKLNFPKFALAKNRKSVEQLVYEVGFPLIGKPVKGKGSVGVIQIHTKVELERILEQKEYIIQEYLGNEDSEYTIGCYRNKSGKILNPIIMRRKLKYGTTFEAEIIENQSIKDEAIKICEKFEPIGPLNIQMRLDKNNKPTCFELNVRFSGTTPIRAYFGFNDVAALIKEYVLKEEMNEDFYVRKGIAFRYMNEIYLEKDLPKKLEAEGSLKNIRDYQISVDKTGGC